MAEIKKIIDELGIAALEANTKIASAAVVSDLGSLIYQTDNWDLQPNIDDIMKVIKGDRSLVVNNTEFSVREASAEGIIGTNDSGMGHVIFAPFQGGFLVSYAMPGANPPRALSFLKKFASRLNGKL